MDNTTSWPKEWSESESDLKQDVSKKDCLCIISEIIPADSEELYKWHMPLKVSTYIPVSNIIIVTSDDYEAWLLELWDSCAEINTVNILINQWIITHNPHLI